MGPRNDVRRRPDGTIEILLDHGKFVRINGADYSKVADFYWFTWCAPVQVEYAVASVLVDGEVMFIAMPDVIAANDDRFEGIQPTRPSRPEAIHAGMFNSEVEAAIAHDQAAVRYFGSEVERNVALGLLPPETIIVDGVTAGQVITPTA